MEGLIEQRHPSLELALELLARIRAEADACSLSLAVSVVDAGGHVIASQRMDGAALGAMRLAMGKAYTAVLWGTRSGYFMESTNPAALTGASMRRTSVSSSTRAGWHCSPAAT